MTGEADRFDGDRVVITGVGRAGQVGEAVAAHFASLGAHLILLDRDAEGVRERAATLRADGAEAQAFACDLTSADALAAVVRDVAAAPGGVKALVCLAGGFAAGGPVADSPPDLWQRMVAINLTTAQLTTHAFLPLVREAGGAIVYFASAAALPGGRTAGMGAYAAAKAAVVTLMLTVAEEERPHGVRANALAPTAIRTGTNVAAMGSDASYVEREVVADWVAKLCALSARNITGQVVKLG
jgi:NAD(P)-dependent dehydrogenase (short-subunit alcohol dehydrogenase family)